MCESHVLVDGALIDPNDYAQPDPEASRRLAVMALHRALPGVKGLPNEGQFIEVTGGIQ